MSVKRVYILCSIFFSLFLCILIRVAYIQFLSDRPLAESAFRQKLANNSVEMIRGNILDRNGISFTNRSPRYIAFIKSAFIPASTAEQEKICAVLDIDIEYLNEIISKNEKVMIETNKTGSDAIAEIKPDWVSILHSVKRYDEGTLAKHVIGYLNRKDRIGQSGIEKAYEKEIRDNEVFEIGAVTDAAKNPIKGLGYRLINWGSSEKYNVKLTLDYHIQKIVENVMDENRISGAIVVEDAATGDVLAMASRPDFDQDSVEDYLDSRGNELFNKATAAYNLGSVFKIIDIAALLENINKLDGKIRGEFSESMFPDFSKYTNYDEANNNKNNDFDLSSAFNLDNYRCTGMVEINGLVFKCSSYFEGGHGLLNLEEAFAESCNSYFIEMCQKIGYRNLISTAQRFGFGAESGITKQGVNEAKGSLPPLKAYYSRADIANISIGQGALLATPLQVADIVAIIANGGIKNKVNIVDSIVDDDGKTIRKIRKNQGQRIISVETADRIRDLMEAVTSYGTGTEARMDYFGGAGGKTGSAETGSEGVVHAWFAGYFPVKEPKYAIAVFVENGLYGGKAAAPLFAEIARKMTDKGY